MRQVGCRTPTTASGNPSATRTGYGLNLAGALDSFGKDTFGWQLAAGRAIASCMDDAGVDLAAELLARELKADVFVMLTDAEAVYLDRGRPTQRAIRRASPAALAGMEFAAGSMGPKVDAACRFATATGKPAAIGALADLSVVKSTPELP